MSHGQNLRTHPLPTLDRLNELLVYNPDTGLMWRRFKKLSKIVGTKGYGYLRVGFDGSNIRVHRLAWFMTYGVWPDVIDHINGDKADNRLVNLRDCSHRQNIRAENAHAAPFGVFVQGHYWNVQWLFGGRRKFANFSLWRDAVAFREYVDRGFEKFGEDFKPVIPPKSERIIKGVYAAKIRLSKQSEKKPSHRPQLLLR